jgi:hypothetical protein
MSNRSKVLAMADAMVAEVKASEAFGWRVPDWAGLAWVMSPFYCSYSAEVKRAMGEAWAARAGRVVEALRIAAEWRAEQRMLLPDA